MITMRQVFQWGEGLQDLGKIAGAVITIWRAKKMSTCGVNRNKYLDNPPQNYHSKFATAIICNNYRQLPKSVSTFWALDLFRRFVGFFRRFVGIFRRFKTGKHMQNDKNAKLFGGRTMPPAIIPEKVIILHTLEDAGMLIMGRMGPNFEFKGVLTWFNVQPLYSPYGSKHLLRRYLTPQIMSQTLPKKVLGSIGSLYSRRSL